MSVLKIAFLGPPQIFSPQGGEIALPNRKALALLAYLAVESASAHSRDSALGLLWPELPTSDARNNLRVTWSQLRQRLGEHPPEKPFLISTRLDLRFNPGSDHWLDVAAFQDLLETCRLHSHPDHWSCVECGERLARAEELVRGDFLEGFLLGDCPAFDEWSFVQRERIYLQITGVLEELAGFHEHAVNLGAAERYVRRLLELDPLRERAHRQLMRLLSRAGRRSAALAQFEVCQRLLADELGVTPSPETSKLAEQIRSGAPGQRLTMRHNLPAPPSRFIGRKQESAMLQEVLMTGAERFVTITGSGGVGKTRLALQVANGLVDRFPQGVWFIELAALRDPLAVPGAVAATLNVPEEGWRSLVLTLSNFLRDKSLLLILDNCEHVLMASAQLIKSLHSAAPQLVVLATSRAPLRLQGEQVMRLHPLSSPEIGAAEALTAAGALQYEAVQLFASRAAQALLSFTVTDANAATVALICRHLDGIPLAIELAAARANAMPVEAIARRLDQRFRWLNSRSSSPLPRHQTLRALIDWSYDLLETQERILFRQLAVFAGGWTLEAVEAICNGGELCVDILTGLVDQSLVVFGYDPARKRYRMHETIRAYARRRLRASGEEPNAQSRHARYYACLVRQLAENANQVSLQDRLDQVEWEHANLWAAIAWAAQYDRALALAMAADLGGSLNFWELRGHYEEGRNWLQRILEATHDSNSQARAKALLASAALSSALTDFEYGQVCSEEARRLFRRLDDRQGEVDALLVSAELAIYQGEHERLTAFVEEGMAIARELNYRPGLAKGGWLLGVIANHQGDCDQAIQHLLPSVALWREMGDVHKLASALNSLAGAMMIKNQYADACRVLQETVAINRELGYRRGVALALHNLAESAMYLSDYSRARKLNAESLSIRRELGLRRGYAFSFENFALLAERENQLPRAVQLFAAAQALREAIGSPVYAFNQEDQARSLERARSILGEVRFELEWSKGRALTDEQAIELALTGTVDGR